MSDPRTDLPAPGAPNFNQRLREVIQTYLGRQGNPLDRGLTVRDLVDIGVLKLRAGFQLKPGAGSSIPLEPGDGVVDTYEPDLTPPPTPGNMMVTASISHVMIEHEAPLYRQGHGHLRTRVYGKVVNAGDPLPTFADATEIGQFSGTIYAQPSNPATTWRLWVKWETVDGVLSVDPAGGINGIEAITGQDVALLLEALTGKITDGQLYQDLKARIDLVDGPDNLPGSVSARIKSEQVQRETSTGALAKSVTTLQASAGTGGLIYNGSFANGSAEGWSGLSGVSSTPYGGLPKAYAGIQTTRDINFPNTDASQWMACRPGDEFEVSAWVSAEHPSPRYSIGIQYENTDGSIENWVPIAGTEGPTTAKLLHGYWTATNDARRLRFWGQINTPNGTTASAWGITDAQLRRTDARTGANTAAIQVEAETRAEQAGELYAKYGIKLDVNGYVTGWAMNNNGSTGDMIVLADRFAVGAPGAGNIIPFVVNTTPQTINGVEVPAGTYMDAAYIKNGTITNAKIGNAAIDDAKIANLSASKITAGTIAVGQWIASSNYISGTQGWAINGSGSAEFGSASIRGQLKAEQIDTEGLTIKHNGRIILGAGASLPAEFVIPDGGWLNSNLTPSIKDAQDDASEALGKISDIFSDGKLTPVERVATRKEWDVIAAEWLGIWSSGGDAGLTTLQNQYQDATRALGSYLNGGPWVSFDVIPAGISDAYLGATTDINGTEFRSKFQGYYTARQAILNALPAATGSAARSGAVSDVTPSINAKLSKAGDTISGRISFTVADGMFAGSDTNNGVYFGKDGLVGRKGGANTFYINTAGDAVFRGDITASRFMTGGFSGWAWPSSGLGGSYLGPEGLLLGNYNDSKYFQVTSEGNVYAPGMKIENGALTISQANVINTLNLAGNAVTIPVSAYTESSDSYTGSNVEKTIQTITFTSSGAPVLVTASCEHACGNILAGSGDSTYYENQNSTFRLYRNGVLLQAKSVGSGTVYFQALDTPGSGSVTYQLRIHSVWNYGTSGTKNAVSSYRALNCLEVKR